jgi:sulfite reductase (ferredoxin)
MRGDRLNFIYKDMVPLENIVDELLPLLAYYKREGKPDESLGDFFHRKSVDDLKQFDEP